MCENDVIYTDDVGTAAVFRAILSNANDQADNFSFAGHRAKAWKRRNTGRIGVGAFRRTTLQIGSYTDNNNSDQPNFLLDLPGESCTKELVPEDIRPELRQQQKHSKPVGRSRHTFANTKRQKRMGNHTQQIPRPRKRSSKFRGLTRRRKALSAWPEPATARKINSHKKKKSCFRQSPALSIKRKIHSKREAVSLKEVLQSLDPSKRTKTKAFKSREAKPAWLAGLQQVVDLTDNRAVPSVRRKASSGLLARLQRVLRVEEGELARLKHQSLCHTGSEHGDILRSRSQITLECLRSHTTQEHHHCVVIVKNFKQGSKPCGKEIPKEGTALIAILRNSSSSTSYSQGTLIRVYAPWHLIPAAIMGEPPTLICTLMEVIADH